MIAKLNFSHAVNIIIWYVNVYWYLQDDVDDDIADSYDIDGTYVPRIYFLGKFFI